MIQDLSSLIQKTGTFVCRNYVPPQERGLIFYQTEIYPSEDDLKAELGPTFSQVLFKYIRQKSISETECYKRSNIDRRLFSKIRSDKNYQPNKATVLALIFGLKLTRDEANHLMKVSGYSLSSSIKRDLVLIYLLRQQVYDINVVNEVLHSLNLKTLGPK